MVFNSYFTTFKLYEEVFAESSVARTLARSIGIYSLTIWLNFCFTALYSGVSLPFNGAAILSRFFIFFIRVHLHNLL